MKFGRQIKRQAEPTHFNHCIAYDVLKKAITVVVSQDPGKGASELREMRAIFGQATGTAGMTPVARFHSLLQHELAKVNRFAKLLLRALLDTLREAQQIIGVVGSLKPEDLAQAEQLLTSAKDQLVSFERFQRLNFTGFKKIAKKFDKQSDSGSLSGWFLPKLMREFFVNESLDAQLLALALGHAALRRLRRRASGEAVPDLMVPTVAPGFCTRTFWLMPKERMSVLCSLVKRFDVVRPSAAAAAPGSEGLSEEMRRMLLAMAPDGVARSPCHLTAQNTLSYYDGPSFKQYSSRLGSAGPAGFRSRQTGGGSAECTELVERDGALAALGPNAFTSMPQLRLAEEFPLQASAAPIAGADGDLAALLAAAEKIAQCDLPGAILSQTVKALANEVHLSAAEEPLRCMAEVSSNRVVLSGDTVQTRGIAMVVDVDVRFTRAAGSEPSEAVDFPYCLLEVATSEEVFNSGAWLDEIRSMAAIRDVQGFSVGAHAVAALHSDAVPALPEWYEHLNNVENWAPEGTWGLQKELREAITEAQEAQGGEANFLPQQQGPRTNSPFASPEQRRQPDYSPPQAGIAAPPALAPRSLAFAGKAPMTAMGSLSAAGEPGPAQTVVAPLEPKNFMASERTMLEWFHTVLALAFLGVGLWRYSLSLREPGTIPKPIAGGILNAATTSSLLLGCYSLVLVAVSIGFAWYGVLSHTARLKALLENRHTEAVFNRRTAPGLFAVIVGLALSAHLAVQLVPLVATLGGDAGDASS